MPLSAIPYDIRFYLQHWAQDYWRDKAQARGDEGQPFLHTASDQLGPRGVQPGDRLYVVGSEHGKLLLIGRMDIGYVVRTEEAKRLLGASVVFPRVWHAIAIPPLAPLSFERRVPESVARTIKTEDGKLLKIDPTIYRIASMALVTGRFIDPSSAAALDSLMEGEFAESEEVRDVQIRARARAWPSQTTQQRKAVEHHAVKAAALHFEAEGWNVQDVGLTRPYDLHCTRGVAHLHVEVKGTTGPLSTVPLTAGEVELSRQKYPATALFVVHEIKLDGSPSKPRPRGGQEYVEQPWRPTHKRLKPVAYSYRLS